MDIKRWSSQILCCKVHKHHTESWIQHWRLTLTPQYPNMPDLGFLQELWQKQNQDGDSQIQMIAIHLLRSYQYQINIFRSGWEIWMLILTNYHWLTCTAKPDRNVMTLGSYLVIKYWTNGNYYLMMVQEKRLRGQKTSKASWQAQLILWWAGIYKTTNTHLIVVHLIITICTTYNGSP